MSLFARGALVSVIVFGFFVSSLSPAQSGDRAAWHLARACGAELVDYCGTVTAGAGRKLACLYLHADKVSVRCARSLRAISIKVEKAVVAMQTVADRCTGDIEAHCAGIVPGSGRVALCLMANEPSLSGECRRALADPERAE